MSVETYNPKDISIIVGGFVMAGFSDDKVRVFRESDAWTDESGADGEVVRYATNDKRGEIEVTLLQTSSSNLTLTTLAKADELTGAGIIPTIVKDNRGNDLHVAPKSWIVKIPEAKYSKSGNVRVWRIRSDNLQMILGGS